VRDQLRRGTLRCVLEPYAASVPGFYLYYPSRARRSAPLALFIEALGGAAQQRATRRARS